VYRSVSSGTPATPLFPINTDDVKQSSAFTSLPGFQIFGAKYIFRGKTFLGTTKFRGYKKLGRDIASRGHGPDLCTYSELATFTSFKKM